ncbi:MAG: hypothetical protein ACTSPZ_00885 [Promethearchaeota archaeon]
MQMDNPRDKPDKETLIKLVKQGIEMLAEKNISSVLVLSSYKINSVLKDNYGVDIKVDRIGRILSSVAKNNKLKRLTTQIPKYQLQISKVGRLQYPELSSS